VEISNPCGEEEYRMATHHAAEQQDAGHAERRYR
jgi:hypothetical protein